jgi:monoamine oxidase
MRLDGGLQSLVEALSGALPGDSVRLEKQLVSLDFSSTHVELEVADARSGAKERLRCRAVVTAFAPRLLAGRLRITPPLPDALRTRFSRAPTWLGGQAKAIAVYETPFWREQGNSGLVSSVVGPLQEIHDASPQKGAGALFGFFGISSAARQRLAAARLRELVLAQLVRLFGPRAASPIDFFYKDWTEEPYIAGQLDREVPSQYPQLIVDADDDDPWKGRLLFAGSELALEHQGYLEGALEAAERAAAGVLEELA